MRVHFLIFLCGIVPTEKSDLKFGHSILQEQEFQQEEDISLSIFKIPDNGDTQTETLLRHRRNSIFSTVCTVAV